MRNTSEKIKRNHKNESSVKTLFTYSARNNLPKTTFIIIVELWITLYKVLLSRIII
jgi:hypothetical protein